MASINDTRASDMPPEHLCDALSGRRAVLVTGGTGFIGRRLVEALVAAGHDVTVLSRDREQALRTLSDGPARIVASLDDLNDDMRIDAVVNLAGEPISDSPWTTAKRQRIVQSRVAATDDIVRLVARLTHTPEVLVSGSAIGWYGLQGDEPLTEASSGQPCFSRNVCVQWEEAARKAEHLGVRTVFLRTGLVLGRGGGMLARLLLPFRLGLGGRFGDGRHWMSWIHRDDLVRLIILAIADTDLTGPLNGTAPAPVTNRMFTQVLAKALHRPAFLHVPAWPLRLLLGDFAQELLLSGQRVMPDAALRHGFDFRYPTLEAALSDILLESW